MNPEIRRDSRVRCLKRDADDCEFDGIVSHVHKDKKHFDIRGGFLGMLSREHVPIKFVKLL